jgi:hypothetical protein
LVERAFETAPDPSDGRDTRGQFAEHNRAAVGSGFKAQIRRSLGNPDDPTVGELVRDALKMYRGLLRALPYSGPLVRPLVAAQCRHSVLGTHYANLAARAGLDTPAGMKLSDKAGYHDGLSGQFSTRGIAPCAWRRPRRRQERTRIERSPRRWGRRAMIEECDSPTFLSRDTVSRLAPPRATCPGPMYMRGFVPRGRGD